MKRVTIMGLGMGNPDMLTLGALHALQQAGLIVGAQRMLDALPEGCTQNRRAAIRASDIIAALDAFPACVVMSGDTGFYSGTKTLLPLLSEYHVTVLPGMTTVQYLAAKLGRPWQDVTLASAHGVDCDVLGAVLQGKETFFLTGGSITPTTIAGLLDEAGLGFLTMHVGQRLSYPDESILSATAAEQMTQTFAPLSAVWIERLPACAYRAVGSGIPDDEFIRGSVPMTKQEVRAAIPGKLGILPGDVIYDIGAGTGSVSIELARAHPSVRLFAVECNADGCHLIMQNRAKFGAYNLSLCTGHAPEALEPLPAPDAVFIGGTKGALAPILNLLLLKNPAVRVCISAIAAETMAEAVTLLSQPPFTALEITQISVARSREVGSYHMMTAQNPIFLISARGTTP